MACGSEIVYDAPVNPKTEPEHCSSRCARQSVEDTINELLTRGLSPAEAWNYYGVEMQDISQTEWGERTGREQSTISKSLTRAKQKLKGQDGT